VNLLEMICANYYKHPEFIQLGN